MRTRNYESNVINNDNDAKLMNDLRNNILTDYSFCFGWCVTYNADPSCIESEEDYKGLREEVEDNAITEITDPEDRETALERLDAVGYEGSVYRAGEATFITNNN